MFRDGVLKSIWQDEILREGNASVKEGLYDVVIAGAGISGLSCAIRLQKSGMKCLLLEAENIGFGTTGGTTAHLNTFFDASYDEVIRDFGLENAKIFSRSGPAAIEFIQSMISEFGIDCDFETKEAYLFATDPNQLGALNKLKEAGNEVGIPFEYTQMTPFPIPFLKAVRVNGQAEFHPLLYLRGLRKAFQQLGGEYIRKCRVMDYKSEADELIISTSLGEVKTRNLIYATHTPPGVNLLHFRNIPWRSYVMAVELKDGNYPQALGYDLEEIYHYYRTHEREGKKYLIVGGKDHKTGIKIRTEDCFAQLETHIRTYFEVKKVVYKWSSQYFEPVDGLPYIGRIPGGPDNVFVCTGYNGNGMIFGTMAGIVIPDLILGKSNSYENLFNPRRVKPIAGFKKFISHNTTAVGYWFKNQLSLSDAEKLEKLPVNCGEIVEIDKSSYAVFKELNGECYILENNCSHAGCSVEWNESEMTWDCPCHGSRFGVKGNVLTAPAVKPLSRKELKDTDDSLKVSKD
ncbi:MAG: FAD-dependent oxidoreductase [Flavobacteriaceae bacterium]|jgi:glycine/D-amino acid oxidase-like deaminating enzyme/nitrite reductase/ring-hydroxylating ferredoxin subunit|nr:FAD-dependent oxidoreductase [Flavobacteriaceae bacterium]